MFPIGRALLEKGLQSFDCIVRRHQLIEIQTLDIRQPPQTSREIRAAGADGQPEARSGERQQMFPDVRKRGVHGIAARNLIDQPHAERLIGLDDSSRQTQILGVPAADAIGEHDGGHGRKDAEFDLRLSECRLRRGDDAMAERRQLQSAAQASATHGRHNEH